MPQTADPHRSPWLLRPGEWALVIAIVLAVGLTAVADANHSYWFRPLESLRDILRNVALLGIFALGATVVIIAGGIDLSAGSMIALSGTVCATTMLALGHSPRSHSSARVDSSGVKNDSKPICRTSPRLSAASQR